MNMVSPFCTINCSCNDALQWTTKQLSQASLRVMQTFDLNTARHTLEDCPCPHHGMDACDCQLVILLVYGNAGEPVTLILHGNDGQTWISIVENPRQPADAKLITTIQQVLETNVSPTVSGS
jgi:hypothetical protein